MNILLIKPRWPYPYDRGEHTYNRIWQPLSLANCAALLERQGHRVKILDAHALRMKPEGMKSYLLKADKVFITSSSLDRWQCPNINIAPFIQTVRYVRDMTEECYVMGYHGTVDPENILNMTRAKAVIRGEPESAVNDIGLDRPFEEINGLTFKRDGQVVSAAEPVEIDLKTLPVPAYHLLDIKKYHYEILGRHFAMFELGRGCNHTCRFCNKVMYGQRLRTKSGEQVVRELKFAIEQCGVRTGYFMDLEFLAQKGLVRDVCDFLIHKNYDFRWCAQTRADALDPGILNKIKMAGCELIHMGVESGVQEILDLSGKHTTKEKLVEGVRMCAAAGIKTLAFYIIGFCGEKEENRKETLAFAKRLNTNFASFHKVYPYKPGNIYDPELAFNKKLDHSILRMYLAYYLRPGYWSREHSVVLLRNLSLFLSRLVTLS